MSMNLPESIANYLRSKSADAPSDSSASFTPDAVVIDKGEDAQYEGRDAIRQWMTGQVAGYSVKTEVTGVVEQGEETVVTALVSGDFPGSPAEFQYRFTLRDSLIFRLVIEFVAFR
ncbi:nuclear transport factor 2 family protein [bacterium]|nr:MAG: nuclear transport factor 2 family protein [bacterium]